MSDEGRGSAPSLKEEGHTAGRRQPAAGVAGNARCGKCDQQLEWVGPTPECLNRDQWDSMKAGEYFLPARKCADAECPGRPHMNGNRYWGEIEAPKPVDWQARAEAAEADRADLVEALKDLLLVRRLAALKYDFDLTGSVAIERAETALARALRPEGEATDA